MKRLIEEIDYITIHQEDTYGYGPGYCYFTEGHGTVYEEICDDSQNQKERFEKMCEEKNKKREKEEESGIAFYKIVYTVKRTIIKETKCVSTQMK